MGEKKRENFTAQEKVCILKQHFVEKKAVSNLCDENGIRPVQLKITTCLWEVSR